MASLIPPDHLSDSLSCLLEAPVAAGIPAKEGLNAHETMMSAADYESPQEAFGGRPRPRFLEEALEAGAQQAAAERAEIAAKKAARVKDQ